MDILDLNRCLSRDPVRWRTCKVQDVQHQEGMLCVGVQPRAPRPERPGERRLCEVTADELRRQRQAAARGPAIIASAGRAVMLKRGPCLARGRCARSRRGPRSDRPDPSRWQSSTQILRLRCKPGAMLTKGAVNVLENFLRPAVVASLCQTRVWPRCERVDDADLADLLTDYRS